jgi:hypothetical protein
LRDPEQSPEAQQSINGRHQELHCLIESPKQNLEQKWFGILREGNPLLFGTIQGHKRQIQVVGNAQKKLRKSTVNIKVHPNR